MSEVFKTKTEPQVEAKIKPSPQRELPNDEARGNKASDPLDAEQHKLDIWEFEHKHKYGEDLFDIKNTSHEFPLKAHFGFVDKFIKAELELRGWEKNTQNYEKILTEFETEAGTTNLETYRRLERLFQYLTVVGKYRTLREKKEAFRNSTF